MSDADSDIYSFQSDEHDSQEDQQVGGRIEVPQADTPEKRRKALRKAIIDYVLENRAELSALSFLDGFIDEITSSGERKLAAAKRIDALRDGRSHFETLDQDRLARSADLDAAVKELSSHARSLGTAAFQARLAEEVADIPAFFDRLELHRGIEAIQQELQSLRDSPGQTILEKGKVKAQQGLLFGRLKVQQARIGKADAALGNDLLKNRQEEQVRSAATNQALDAISAARQRIADFEKAAEIATVKLEEWTGNLDASLGLKEAKDVNSFDEGIEAAQEDLATIARSTRKAKRELVVALLESSSSIPKALREVVNDLRGLTVRLDDEPADSSDKFRNLDNPSSSLAENDLLHKWYIRVPVGVLRLSMFVRYELDISWVFTLTAIIMYVVLAVAMVNDAMTLLLGAAYYIIWNTSCHVARAIEQADNGLPRGTLSDSQVKLVALMGWILLFPAIVLVVLLPFE